jgi:Na+/melibiose symporter-like transporter
MNAQGGLLRNRDFRLVAGSVGLSAFGDWVAIVALGLQVKQLTGAGLEVAALWICLFGPSVVLAAHAGLLVDRVEATRLLTVVSAAGTALALALGLLAGESLGVLLALTALLGAVFAISQPAEFALVPLLAGTSRAQEANGHVETARYVGFGLGPLVGGIAFAAGGLELAMIIDALTFALVAIAATRLRVRREPARSNPAAPARAGDGIAVLFGDRLLRLVMVVAVGSLVFMSAVWVAELFFVKDVLGRGDIAYGLMFTAWTTGMALGALVISRRVAAGAIATVALAAVAVQGLGLALPAGWLAYGFFVACAFAGGVAHGVKNVMFRSLIHLHVPDDLHGRAFAAFNGLRNSAELAAFGAGGLLVAAIGARGTVAYAGGLSALAGAIGLLVLLRRNYGWVSTKPVGQPAATATALSAPRPAPAR